MILSIVTPRGSMHLARLRIGSLAASALVAATFVLAGAAKISSTPSVVELSEAIGIGQSLRYVAKLVEVTAMLPLSGFIGLDALLLAATMVGAQLGHLFVFGDSLVETLFLLAATSAILFVSPTRVPRPHRRPLTTQPSPACGHWRRSNHDADI